MALSSVIGGSRVLSFLASGKGIAVILVVAVGTALWWQSSTIDDLQDRIQNQAAETASARVAKGLAERDAADLRAEMQKLTEKLERKERQRKAALKEAEEAAMFELSKIDPTRNAHTAKEFQEWWHDLQRQR